MYRENRLKQRLYSGHKALGCWLATGNPMAAEIIALAGYDFIMIDHEHGPADVMGAVGVLQAISASDSTSLLRVPWNDPVYIKRALDIGTEGIMVPMIETAAEARAAVAACRYPPEGNRGVATSIVRATDYGLSEDDYVQSVNDNLVILCQIESLKAIDNIEEIAATEGVDVLFVGPADIAADIGLRGQLGHPEVKETLARAEAAIKGAGKLMGTVPRAGLDAPALFEMGYDMVSGGSDVTHIRNESARQVAAHREKYGSQ